MYREVVRIPTDPTPVDNAALDLDLVLDGHEQYLADAKHHSEDYVADVRGLPSLILSLTSDRYVTAFCVSQPFLSTLVYGR